MGIPGRYRTLFLSDNLFILFHFYREIVKNIGRNSKYINISKVFEDEKGYVYCTECPSKMKRSDRNTSRHFKRHHKERDTVSLMQTRPKNPLTEYIMVSEDSDDSVDRYSDHNVKRITEMIDANY